MNNFFYSFFKLCHREDLLFVDYGCIKEGSYFLGYTILRNGCPIENHSFNFKEPEEMKECGVILLKAWEVGNYGPIQN